jgi:hypothetical protein
MEIKNQVEKMDNLVSQGDMVGAITTFFADEAATSDYGKVTTDGKSQMIEKMEGFLGSIEKVNGITHHHSIVDGNVSASEFTFDFDMKDGSKIYWHEIIRRIWNEEGKITQEEYFNAQN